MDLCDSGVSTDLENNQVLGGPVPRATQGETDGIFSSTDGILAEASYDPKWLK